MTSIRARSAGLTDFHKRLHQAMSPGLHWRHLLNVRERQIPVNEMMSQRPTGLVGLSDKDLDS